MAPASRGLASSVAGGSARAWFLSVRRRSAAADRRGLTSDADLRGADGADLLRAGRSGLPLLNIGGTGGDLRRPPSPFEWPGARRFEQVAYDHRGLGRSRATDPQAQPTMADFAEDALALADHLGMAALLADRHLLRRHGRPGGRDPRGRSRAAAGPRLHLERRCGRRLRAAARGPRAGAGAARRATDRARRHANARRRCVARRAGRHVRAVDRGAARRPPGAGDGPPAGGAPAARHLGAPRHDPRADARRGRSLRRLGPAGELACARGRDRAVPGSRSSRADTRSCCRIPRRGASPATSCSPRTESTGRPGAQNVAQRAHAVPDLDEARRQRREPEADDVGRAVVGEHAALGQSRRTAPPRRGGRARRARRGSRRIARRGDGRRRVRRASGRRARSPARSARSPSRGSRRCPARSTISTPASRALSARIGGVPERNARIPSAGS